MNEIRASYGLLFKDDGPSRKLYRNERGNAAFRDVHGRTTIDPSLDKACGYYMSTRFPFFWDSPLQEIYRVNDFPVFSQRLERLHKYIDGVEPSHIGSIWHDRRDRRLWWTFWTVLIFGLITILLALVTIGLAIWQGTLAQKQIELAMLELHDN